MSSPSSIPNEPASSQGAGAQRPTVRANPAAPIGKTARLDYRRAWGSHLRALREQRGLTQRQLEQQAALTKNLVGRVELGEGSVGVDCVLPLAAALGIQPGELFPPGPDALGTASVADPE